MGKYFSPQEQFNTNQTLHWYSLFKKYPRNRYLIPQTEDKHWRPVIAFITHVGNTKASQLLHITEYMMTGLQ